MTKSTAGVMCGVGHAGVFAATLLTLVALGGVAWMSGAASWRRADVTFHNGPDVESLDPAEISSVAGGRIARALYEGLVVLDPETLAPVPGVAESWERSEDGRAWTFRLRACQWSNGDPVTAGDFVSSWRRLLDPESAAPYASLLDVVVGARGVRRGEAGAQGAALGLSARDRRTLCIELVRPCPELLQILSMVPLMPVHGASLRAIRERWGSRWREHWGRPGALIGNGPFRLGGRRLGDRIRLLRNERYWGADEVALDCIDALACERITTALHLYLAGECQWVGGVPVARLPELASRPDYTSGAYLGIYFYRINVTRPPLDDVRVRRALWLALPREEICTHITRAGQRPARSFVPPGTPGYEPVTGLGEDLRGAADLFEEAGFPGGAGFPALEIQFNSSEQNRDIAEVIARAWHLHLGIEVELRNQEAKVHRARQRGLQFQVSRSSWIADFPSAGNFLEIFAGESSNNRTGWRSEAFDAAAQAAREELDSDRRRRRWAEAERILLEEAPILPIYFYVTRNLVDPSLRGFFENPLDLHPVRWWRRATR